MCSFRSQSDEIPKHIGILQVGCRVSFLGVDKTWEKYGISNEKDWCIISDQIPIALFGVEFHSKSTRVTGSVCWSWFTSNCAVTNCNWSLFSNFRKDGCLLKKGKMHHHKTFNLFQSVFFIKIHVFCMTQGTSLWYIYLSSKTDINLF